jgi:hypothetical protein
MRLQAAGQLCALPGRAAFASQQHWQIFFSFAFTRASSTPIESIFLLPSPSALETGAARDGRGPAIADEVADGAAKSQQSNLAGRVRDRFALWSLRNRDVAQHANRDDSGEDFMSALKALMELGREEAAPDDN